MSDTPMMGCGHAANSIRILPDGTEAPACVICFGIHEGAEMIVPTSDLTGRMARCGSHGEVSSSTRLAFFRHQPDQPFDSYYCGHAGWD